VTAQNPNPQPDDVGRHTTKNKRPRPFAIEYRFNKEAEKISPWLKGLFRDCENWKPHKWYRTEDERDRALDQLALKHASKIFEYRKGE